MKNTIVTREDIIKSIYDNFISNEAVHAYWLEGSDGTDNVDEYSDIDIVLDVEDGKEDEIFKEVEKILSRMGEMDFNYEGNVNHPKLRQKFYHLNNSSEYLIVDFCIQSHSRDKEESAFTIGDKVEFPKVLFDKCNVISYKSKPNNEEKIRTEISNRIEELKSRYKQHSRVVKYLEREKYLEAYLYYGRYVVEPIVELMRMKYTPDYYYLFLIHISDHIPEEERKTLEKLYQNKTLEDIRANINLANEVFARLIDEVNESLKS